MLMYQTPCVLVVEDEVFVERVLHFMFTGSVHHFGKSAYLLSCCEMERSVLVLPVCETELE